jgi:hypothetical protein
LKQAFESTSEQYPRAALLGRAAVARLPVGLVHKDSSEVTNDVDNTEHGAVRRIIGEPGVVFRDRTTGVPPFRESHVGDRIKVKYSRACTRWVL